MTSSGASERVAEMQGDWFVREVKRCREIGMPLGCCDNWPECSHVLAWLEESGRMAAASPRVTGGGMGNVTSSCVAVRGEAAAPPGAAMSERDWDILRRYLGPNLDSYGATWDTLSMIDGSYERRVLRAEAVAALDRLEAEHRAAESRHYSDLGVNGPSCTCGGTARPGKPIVFDRSHCPVHAALPSGEKQPQP